MVLLGAAAALGGPARAMAQAASAVGADIHPAERKPGPMFQAGQAMALPAVERLDGSRFEPAQADGRVLVLYWWASTCPFCAQQSPEMETLWRGAAARGLLMLGLSIDKTPQAARDYLQRKGYTFPSAWVTPEVQRVLPKPMGLPITVVRGRDGRVLQAERGQLFPEDVVQLAQWLA
jgi:hypothetical protein